MNARTDRETEIQVKFTYITYMYVELAPNKHVVCFCFIYSLHVQWTITFHTSTAEVQLLLY